MMLLEKPRIDLTSRAQGGEPSSLSDVWESTDESERLGHSSIGRAVAVDRAYGDRIDAIEKATGEKLSHPLDVQDPRDLYYPPAVNMQPVDVAGPTGLGVQDIKPRYDPAATFQKQLVDVAEKHPDKRAVIGVDRPILDDAKGLTRTAERRASDVWERSDKGALAWAARLGGGFYASLHDPVNIATLAIGGGEAAAGIRGLAWMALKQGAANAGAEAASQPFIQSWRKEAGLDYGISQAALDIGMAGVFGAGLDAGARGLFRAGRRAMGRPYLGPDPTPPVDALDRAAKSAPEGSPLKRASEGDPEALRQVAKDAGLEYDPVVKHALDETETQSLFPAPEHVDDGEHFANLAKAIREESGAAELPAGDAVRPAATREVARIADDAPSATAHVEGKPVEFRAIDPREVTTDAAQFQFKAGGDLAGVTDRLRGVERWDPISAGKAIVFERADGQMVIADGHQRLGLAQRLASDGQDAKIDAYVFREKDGWTPEDVRAYAALKNMRESSGTSVDMAQVMRERPDLIDGSLPLSDAKLREAAMLARLSNPAFDAVVGGRLSPQFAALIGESVQDAGRHAGLLDELADANLQSLQQARLYLKQLLELPTTTETQRIIFGDAISYARPVIADRTKVLDGSLKLLRTDKKILAIVGRDAGFPQGEGVVRGGPAFETVDDIARRLDPQFAEQRDAIAREIEDSRKAVAELRGEQGGQADAALADLQEKRDAMDARLSSGEVSPKNRKATQAKLAALSAELASRRVEMMTGDEPDVAAARAKLQEADYKLREIAERGTAVRKEAQAIFDAAAPERKAELARFLEQEAGGAQIANLVENLAASHGTVTNILNDAAASVSRGYSPTLASRAFVARIGDILEKEGLSGLVRDAERVEPELSPRPMEEPNGAEAKAQTEELQAQIDAEQQSLFALPAEQQSMSVPGGRMSSLRNSTLSERAAEDMVSIRVEIDKAISRALPVGWRAEARQRLVFGDLSESLRQRNPGVPPTLEIEGTFDPYERIVYVSMAATDPVERAFEEAGHALKASGLIPEADYGILRAKAQEINARERFKIDERYGDVYGARWKDDPARLESALEEESIMQMVAARARGESFDKPANVILDKLLKFLRSIRDMLGLKGFRNFEDVFQSMTEGGFAREGGAMPEFKSKFNKGAFDPNIMFAFAGPEAKSADKAALVQAEKMKAEGASRDDIWRKTGWAWDAQGNLFFEIDDSGARFKPGLSGDITGFGKNVFDHPGLYATGFSPGRIHVRNAEVPRGLFDPRNHEIGVAAQNREEQISAVLHEMQHSIDKKRGIGHGANYLKPDVESLRKAIDLVDRSYGALRRDVASTYEARQAARERNVRAEIKAADDAYYAAKDALEAYAKTAPHPENPLQIAYQRDAGEVRARNVQSRRNMSAAERRATPPWYTQDVADADQLFPQTANLRASEMFAAKAESAKEALGEKAAPEGQAADAAKPAEGERAKPKLSPAKEAKRIRDLINQSAAEGKLSREDANAILSRFDSLEKQHKDPVKAKAQLVKEIDAEAAHKKRQAALTESARLRVEKVMTGFRDARGQSDPAKAMVAMIENLGQHELPEGTVGVANQQHAIYGMALAELDTMLHEFRKTIVTGQTRNKARLSNVVRELFGQGTGDKSASEFAKASADIMEKMRQRFNAAGGAIGKRDDWGMPQWHDPVALIRSGKDAWIKYITPLLDIKKMKHPLTGNAMAPADLEKSLSWIHDNIVSDGWHEKEPSMAFRGLGSVANQHGESRFLIFKDADSWMKYADMYGNGQDALAVILNHIKGMSKDIAAMEVLGPNPRAMLTYMQQFVEQQAARRAAGMPAAFPARTEVTGRAFREGGGVFWSARDPREYAARMIDRSTNMWDIYRGNTSAQYSRSVAEFNQTIRNVSVFTKLGGAAVSGVGDLFWQVAARKFAGLPATKIIGDVIRQIAPGGEREARRAGVIAETYLHMHNEAAREASAMSATRITGFIAERVLSLSMLGAVTRAGNHAMVMGIQAHMADQASKAFRELTAPVQRLLRRYGLAERDWDAIRLDASGRPASGDFLTPTAVRDALVARKQDPTIAERYLAMTLGESQYATLTGTLRARAQMYGGAKAGTLPGEALRHFWQFKSFAVNLAILQIERMAREFVSQGFWRGAQYGAFALMSATMGGALITQLQQLRNGKDPRDMADKAFWFTALYQSGGLSIYGDLLYASQNRFGGGIAGTVAGPTAGMATDAINLTYGALSKKILGTDENTNYGREASKLVRRYTPGASLWYLRLAWDRVLMDNLQRTLDPQADAAFRRQMQNARKDYKQQFWWKPGQRAPSRAPDLGAAAAMH